MSRVAMTTVTAHARRLGVSSSSIFARIQRYRFEASMFEEEKRAKVNMADGHVVFPVSTPPLVSTGRSNSSSDPL